jgi:alkanesulfonate monooxygenase SsuD/methylene tetrahydromethanopterin reductase-like flavin-dependent oxidoreductase (luciferase family)
LRFGYGLITCQRHPGDLRTDVDLYAEALALSAEAEELGFDSVWTSEHHFADDAYAPSLLPLSAAIAARTVRVEIGTGLVLAPLYQPVRLAEDSATVDLISGGRFVLGLGLGWLDWEFEALEVPMSERVARTVEAISTCRQAWGHGLVESRGVAVTPKPAREGCPPVWLGATAEPAVRRAARLADGWMASEPSADGFAEQTGWLRDELAKEGREDFEVSGYWPVFTWDGDDAWAQVRDYLHYMEWKYEDSEFSKGRLTPAPLPPTLDEETEAALRDTIICGTPEEVTKRIRTLGEIAGPRFTFVGRMYYPGMDRDVMRRSTQLFAEEVMPGLRAG